MAPYNSVGDEDMDHLFNGSLKISLLNTNGTNEFFAQPEGDVAHYILSVHIISVMALVLMTMIGVPMAILIYCKCQGRKENWKPVSVHSTYRPTTYVDDDVIEFRQNPYLWDHVAVVM